MELIEVIVDLHEHVVTGNLVLKTREVPRWVGQSTPSMECVQDNPTDSADSHSGADRRECYV